MGHSVKIVPEPDFPNYNRIEPGDLNGRLFEVTPAVERAVSRTALEIDSGTAQSWWQSTPIFRDISNAQFQRILSAAAERKYAPRTIIVQEGEAGGQVLVAASGRVKISQISHTGDEVILGIRRAGDVLGGLGMVPGEIHSSTIRTLDLCTILSWKAAEFERLCAWSPTLQRNAFQIMHEGLRIMQECFCELATLKVSSRLARTLLRLGEQNGCGTRNVPITFTCEELGQMAGTTLFTVSRLLSKWAEMGLVYTENREIVLEDIDGLHAIADGGRAAAR